MAVTTGGVHDTRTVADQLTDVVAATGKVIRVATMDASYAITRVFADLEQRGIEAVIPAKAERPAKKGTIPVRRFKLERRTGWSAAPAASCSDRTASRTTMVSSITAPAFRTAVPAARARSASAQP